MAFLYVGQPVFIYKSLFKTKNIKSDSQKNESERWAFNSCRVTLDLFSFNTY
jgi:hypothetical protein